MESAKTNQLTKDKPKHMEDDILADSDMTVEIVGEYVIVKKNDNKSVLDNEDILQLLNEFAENESKVTQLMKEHSELKSMMEVK